MRSRRAGAFLLAAALGAALPLPSAAITPDRLALKGSTAAELTAAGPVGWVFEAALAGSIAEEVQCDPTRCRDVPDHTTPVIPRRPSFAPYSLETVRRAVTGPVSATTISLLQSASEAQLDVTVWERAVFETVNRRAAAQRSGDAASAARQTASLRTLIAQTAAKKRTASAAVSALLRHLAATRLVVRVRPVGEVIAMIRATGFPADERDLLQRAGLTAAEIELARQNSVRFSPAAAPRTFAAALQNVVTIDADNTDMASCRCLSAALPVNAKRPG
jgi:hypothetical protein